MGTAHRCPPVQRTSLEPEGLRRWQRCTSSHAARNLDPWGAGHRRRIRTLEGGPRSEGRSPRRCNRGQRCALPCCPQAFCLCIAASHAASGKAALSAALAPARSVPPLLASRRLSGSEAAGGLPAGCQARWCHLAPAQILAVRQQAGCSVTSGLGTPLHLAGASCSGLLPGSQRSAVRRAAKNCQLCAAEPPPAHLAARILLMA